MKKYIVLMGLVVTLSTATPIQAAIIGGEIASNADTPSINARAEQVEWYYRLYNGKYQKRCWSITYGYWKTNWTNV